MSRIYFATEKSIATTIKSATDSLNICEFVADESSKILVVKIGSRGTRCLPQMPITASPKLVGRDHLSEGKRLRAL